MTLSGSWSICNHIFLSNWVCKTEEKWNEPRQKHRAFNCSKDSILHDLLGIYEERALLEFRRVRYFEKATRRSSLFGRGKLRRLVKSESHMGT